MMDIWVVLDKNEGSSHKMESHVHMTQKGAYAKAYCLLGSIYDSCSEEGYDGEVPHIEQDLMTASKALYNMVMNGQGRWDDEKLEDLKYHFHTFRDIIGEWTDWDCDITIENTRLQV